MSTINTNIKFPSPCGEGRGGVFFLLPLFLLFLLFSCTSSRDYKYIYLRSISVDGEPAEQYLIDEAAEQLAQSQLTVITDRKEARALSANQKLATLKVEIELTHKKRVVDADIDIENFSNNREVFDAEFKQSRDNLDALSMAMQGVIDKSLDWLNQHNKAND